MRSFFTADTICLPQCVVCLPQCVVLASLTIASTQGVSASELRDEPARVVLSNAQATVVFDKEAGGAVVSLIDHATGRELVAGDRAAPLFRLALSQAGDTSGERVRLTSLDAESVAYAFERYEAESVARLSFKGLGGRRLDAECSVSVSAEDGKFRWRLAVKGPEPLILEEVQYPIVVLRTPSRDDDDAADAFVSGAREGGIYPRPSQWPVNTRLAFNQPGPLAAQFSCYYDPSGGFYSATEDGRGYPKRLQFQRTESGLEHAWHGYCYHDLSEPFELDYDVVHAVFHSRAPEVPADWRDAADLYKAWALKQPWCARTLDQRDDLPEWLKQGPAMVRFRRRHTYYKPNVRLEHHPDRYSHPEQIEGWLKDYWQANHAGVPLIVTFWGWEHLASWIAPKYFPPYPSEDGLRRRVEAVRKVGGHPFFWPSGYHWASEFQRRNDGTFEWEDGGYFENVGKPHAAVTRDGMPFARTDFWLAGGTNHILCCGEPWARQWLNDVALKLTERGADLIQIDQVTHGCGPQDRGCCYSRQHDHPPGPGPWFAEAFAEQLRTMLEVTRRRNPGMILGFEGAQEFYLQQIGIQDYRDFEVFWQPRLGREPAPVFAYLYHEFVPLFQSNPEGFRGKPQGGNMPLMAYSLVNGQMPHLVSHWPLEPTPALKNGDFERWEGDEPIGWSLTKQPACAAQRDETIQHGGCHGLRLENRDDGEAVLAAQSLGVGEYEREVGSHGPEVGKPYRLSLWCRGTELRESSRIDVETFDANGVATGSWPMPLVSAADWRRAECAFTIPKRSVRLAITCRLAGGSKAWLDDVALEETGADSSYRPVLETPILPAEHAIVRQWVRLFHGEGRPYLLFGRMLHTPRLNAAQIMHNAFRAPDGSEAVVLVNVTDQVQTGALQWHGKTITLELSPWQVKLLR